MRKHCFLIVTVVSIALIFVSCKKYGSENSEELKKSREELLNWDGTMVFNHPDNPFLKEIPEDYVIHPDSDTMVALIKSICGVEGQNTNVSAGIYSKTLYIADNNSDQKKVKITMYNIPPGKKKIVNVPYVEGATPATGSDAHFAVLNKDTRCLYEFWLFDRFKAGSGNATSIDGTGIYEDGRGTVAAGFSQLQGLVWPKEIIEREINHALCFAVPVTNGNGFVPPATSNDGALFDNPYAIPEGTLVRIDPAFDIEAMEGVNEIDKAVYRAVQKCGMYCNDTNGAGISINGLSVKCIPENSYPDEFEVNETYGVYYLKNFPLDHLQIVYTGDFITSDGPSSDFILSDCVEWE